jgi:hypothetical protein
MSTEIVPIDRELNPVIDFAHIILPQDKPTPFMVHILDRHGKQIGFVRNIEIVIDIRNKHFICKGTRFVVENRNGLSGKVRLDEKNEPMLENFECPCRLDVYDGAYSDGFVAFDPSKNPSERQLRDSLGCRVCGITTDVMFNDRDGIKCEKHRGQATQIQMLDKKP